MSELDIANFEEISHNLLKDPEIRFAGFLGSSGELVAGGFKDGVNPRLTKEQHQSVCEELAARVDKRKKFDNELGFVKYSASRRHYVVIMSFPILSYVLMIVAEPNVNIDRLAFKIINKLGDQYTNSQYPEK